MSSVKTLILGILLIIALGVGGLVYRNAVERPLRPVACPQDARICPDGTAVAREGPACAFPACPSPNVSLEEAGISFALPQGYEEGPCECEGGNDPLLNVYERGPIDESGHAPETIEILRYHITASSTALKTIQKTAIGGTSGAPVPAPGYSSTVIGGRQYTVVAIERFEGVVHTAYYLAREAEGDVLRFDAIDRGVLLDPGLDASALPAARALRALLSTLQAQ